MDLLYKLDDQIDLDDVEEIQQVKAAIARYNSAKTPNTKLRNACRAAMEFLNGMGSKTNLMTMLQNLQDIRKKLNDAISCTTPAVDDSCPKCGAGCDEREFIGKDFIDIEAIHMRYACNKCGSEITEEFTLSDWRKAPKRGPGGAHLRSVNKRLKWDRRIWPMFCFWRLFQMQKGQKGC